MKIIYTLVQTTEVQDELDLSPVDERAVRNALTDTDRRDIIEPLIVEHALSDEHAANAMHERTIRFGIDGTRPDVD